jgi:hypothetical protein
MPGESAKAYRAFDLYRDLGPRRSLDQASRAYHQRPDAQSNGASSRRKTRASGIIRRWAERWNWSARAMAWDQEVTRVRQTERLAQFKEMDDRHIKEMMLLQQRAVERGRLLTPEELTPQDVVRYLTEAIKMERLVRGEPTERVAEEHTFVDVKELTDDELARIIVRGGLLGPGRPRTTAPTESPPESV